MVFKRKQAPLGPRRRISPRSIARDLGVELETVMAALANLGEYVASPASRVEEPVARKLYESLGGKYEPEVAKAPTQWDRKGSNQHSSDRRSSAGERGDDHEQGWSSVDKGDWWETQDDASPAMELESWKLFGFSEAERDVWVSHGLRRGQAKHAAAYRNAGLMPADLSKTVGGWRVDKRLRSGDNPSEVVRLLRECEREGRTG